MAEGVAGCLLFADGSAPTAEALASGFAERGICVTQCAKQSECLNLLRTRRWGLLILDASNGTDGVLHVLSQSAWTYPTVPVVVLVKQGDTDTAVQAVKAGAADCIEAPVTRARLLSLVDRLEGQAGRETHDLWVRLTPMEQIILRYILNSRTNRQIADLLHRSPRTIEVHRRHIMEKLGATNLVELVKQAYPNQRWP